MSIFARKFLIDSSVTQRFKNICDTLELKKDGWACFFIRFELKLLKESGQEIKPNTEAALKQLQEQRKKQPRKEESIKVAEGLLEEMDFYCKEYNFTRAMLVEFALRNACERLKLDKKLTAYRADLEPLYLLENSMKQRKTRKE